MNDGPLRNIFIPLLSSGFSSMLQINYWFIIFALGRPSKIGFGFWVQLLAVSRKDGFVCFRLLIMPIILKFYNFNVTLFIYSCFYRYTTLVDIMFWT